MLLWEWYQSMSDIDKESMDEYIEKNIFRLHELLSIKGPRFVAYLIRSYGITCFGRYTLESLLSLETIHEKNGIVLSAISDHNASIYELSEIHNRVIHTTNGTNMIPMEFTTLGDILIRLRNLRNMMKKHYGKFTPFKYLILQAHGNKK